jgi:hypothetical protein
MTPNPAPAEDPSEDRIPDQPQDPDRQKPAGDPPAKLSEDPRAQRALAKKNSAGGQLPGGQGSGSSKASNSSSKQGKREKKVRW